MRHTQPLILVHFGINVLATVPEFCISDGDHSHSPRPGSAWHPLGRPFFLTLLPQSAAHPPVTPHPSLQPHLQARPCHALSWPTSVSSHLGSALCLSAMVCRKWVRPTAFIQTSKRFSFCITMTTCSTVAALGMMPLCLYLYTRSWDLAQNLTIPYQNIGITLLCLTVPVAFGIYVNYKWPKQSKIILKVGAIVGGLLLLVVAVAGVVLSKEFWSSDTTLLTISFLFPLIGHVAGFLLALLTHQSWQRCRTISLETGAQNIQMCLTMLQLSFTAEHLVQMFNFPLAYGFFQMLDGFLIVTAYQVYQKLKNKHRQKSPDCAEVPAEQKPKETSTFLEWDEAVAVTPGPSGSGGHRGALGPSSPLTSCE
ncbi:solute carrier family 10 member 6 isoform X3 [Fukomys damarensis]|uniref:solute carrier family 10 member 6 isoform X3 n=1 Tax=Fukomys damarensis TaxID=885580 RepID=UPI00053F94EF|nr:solute carrier family 10 member 6 isoform X3 [Fukomys damarensis]